MRLRAMSAGWLELGFFLAQGIVWTVKRATLQSKIVEAALSGLLSFALSDVEHGRLDSKLCSYMTAMMSGKAQLVDAAGKHHSLSRLQLLKHWKLLPLLFTDAVRRVQWLKQMVLFPQDRRQAVASVWGNLQISGEVRARPLDDEGHNIDGQPGSQASCLWPSSVHWTTTEGFRGLRLSSSVGTTSGVSWQALLK